MSTARLPSAGQSQALSELRSIEQATGGAVKVDGMHLPAPEWLYVAVTIDCRGAATGPDGLLDNEQLVLRIPDLYPVQMPVVLVPHDRFAGLPHVVWGDWICLYAGDSDWEPGQGMPGLFRRLVAWLRHVADGTVSGPELPWDPPLTDTSRTPGMLVVRTDFPARWEHLDELWTAWAVVEVTGDRMYEVRRWVSTTGLDAGEAGVGGGRSFLAPFIALPEPVGFAYPSNVGDLVNGVAAQGMDRASCQDLLSEARRASRMMWSRLWDDGTSPLDLLLIGSPAPRFVPGRARIAHIAGWSVDSDDASRQVAWMRVFDQRPQIAARRDRSRPAGWLRGRRVLVLGCGALGAPIAEHCVRAGVSALRIVDSGAVNPGILVRQPYRYDDIGYAKVEALVARLGAVAPDVPCEGIVADAVRVLADRPEVAEADLIVDATANPSVAAALERTRAHGTHPPLLSVMVGHRSERGLATLALPEATGAGADIFRKVAIKASQDDDLSDLLDDFLPDPPRAEPFQPEPGCSHPTFVGSAMDLAAVAGLLLTDALAILETPAASPRQRVPHQWATVVRTPTVGSPGPGPRRLQWLNDVVVRDEAHNYDVRFATDAFARIRREVVRMAGVGGPSCETGGLLLGQVDPASGVVWVTDAEGPPPGSTASAEGLELNPVSARAAVLDRRRRTRGLVDFVGWWHTHPWRDAVPSSQDLGAMEDLTLDGGRVLIVIVGGPPPVWSGWLAGSGYPQVNATLVHPSKTAA